MTGIFEGQQIDIDKHINSMHYNQVKGQSELTLTLLVNFQCLVVNRNDTRLTNYFKE